MNKNIYSLMSSKGQMSRDDYQRLTKRLIIPFLLSFGVFGIAIQQKWSLFSQLLFAASFLILGWIHLASVKKRARDLGRTDYGRLISKFNKRDELWNDIGQMGN
jgi:uncharacterized membrane protein YhaH (DUF805 family)